jgi:hypothetical protein
MSPQEKKECKVRLKEGELYRGNEAIQEGEYIYIVSPKGALYTIDEESDALTIGHSTLRAGQPVLCAGYLSVESDPETNKKIIVSMNRLSGHYQPSTKNFLLTALWLADQKLLSPNCQLKGVESFASGTKVTIQELLTLDKYQSIREDYAAAKSEAKNKPPGSPF